MQLERGVRKPLTVVQDVPTRWNSQLSMIERLLLLKGDLESVVFGGTWDGKPVVANKERVSLFPNENNWKVS